MSGINGAESDNSEDAVLDDGNGDGGDGGDGSSTSTGLLNVVSSGLSALPATIKATQNQYAGLAGLITAQAQLKAASTPKISGTTLLVFLAIGVVLVLVIAFAGKARTG
jgi:hypothetical protein